jgi:hypothetical protein
VKLPLTFHNRDLQECCLRELCFDVPDKNGEPQEKFCCRLPEVVYCCPNQGFAQALITLCNKSNEPRELKWEITIPPASADCPVVLNPLTDFSPSQGSVLVPPGDCREVVVKIDCERLQNVNIPCALFGVTVTDPITGEKEFCRSRVERTDDPTVKHLDPVGSDDGVPAIVDVVIGGGATIGLQVENASDERVEVELVGVGESGAIQFRQGNEKASSEWSSQLRLNARQKRTINVNIGVDVSNPERIAQLQKLGVTAVHFYLRFPDRRTVLAASVPIRILDGRDGNSQQVRVVSVRSVQRPDGTSGVELDCRTAAGLGFQLQVCENLRLTDWKTVPFAVGSDSEMHEQFTSTTEGAVKLFVPMSGGTCFFRLAQDGSEIAQ